MASIRIFSNIALKPRAPVFLANAFLAISLSAVSVKCSLTWRTGNGILALQRHHSEKKEGLLTARYQLEYLTQKMKKLKLTSFI